MPLKSLEFLADKVAYETLPPNWNSFDLGRFSRDKTLWDYQQKALQSALSTLFKYYEDFEDFRPGDDEGADAERREKLREWYEDGMHLSQRERKTLDLSLKKAKFGLRQLLADFYTFDEDDPVIDFQEVCNRMGFWMATGSGKTIVLVKLLEILHHLMRRDEIPVCDVLFLTHREDLIRQFRDTVDEFNHAPDAPMHIELKELRDYPEAKREAPGGLLGRDSTLRVFYYRSDNLNDQHFDAKVDFRNYDNHGRWYVVLDEAHKGTAEDAKRKHIVNILTRAGFLFNFSATFTDAIDLATTVHNFNLSEFIHQGYGKHIAVLKQELAAFKKRGNEDYSDEEKRKVVVKSMLLMAYTAQKVRAIRKLADAPGLYHHPMLLTLVNSVNTDDADLKLYFEQILAIGRGKVTATVWKQAKAELWEELKEEPELLYEDGRRITVAEEDIASLGPKDVWREVYNFESSGNGKGGEVEVLVRPGNKKEIAFKMKTSERPFALIKIGDISEWLKEKLTGFDTIETLDDESFFDGLNDPSSSINILMGSRTFYEGWDSNRPNVINFVNIGTGNDAKKFILQSVGRGVRVQSWQGKRRRLEELHEDFDDRALFRKLKEAAIPPETLYVLGTNRDALRVVLEELKKEKPDRQGLLQLDLNPAAKNHLLLVPEYREAGKLLIEERAPSKFEIADEDLGLLEAYGSAVPSDPVLLLRHGSTPKKLKHFRASLTDSGKYYAKHANRTYRNMEVMVGRVMDYFGVRASELEGLRKLDLDKDIVHFKQMAIDKVHLEEMQRKIDRVLYSQTEAGKKEAEAVYQEVEQMELDLSEKPQEIVRLMEERELNKNTTYNDEVAIEYLANHFYNPAIYSNKGKRIDYLKHIIDVDSEVRFLGALREYVKKADCVLRDLDWWMFSKLDQYTDTPFIPYYSPLRNRTAKFIPDFIFWGQKDEDYTVLFLDPKGMENQDWERKVDGYVRLFEDDEKPKSFEMAGLNVTVKLHLFTRDRNHASEGGYKRFWMDNAKDLMRSGFGL